MEETKRLLEWVRSVQGQLEGLHRAFLHARDLLAWIPEPAESVKEALATQMEACLQAICELEGLLKGDLSGPPSYPMRPMDVALIEMEHREEELQMQRQRNHVLRERVLALTRELLDRDTQKADALTTCKEKLAALPE